MISSGYLGFAAALAVTLGLLFLAVYLLKKIQGVSGSNEGSLPLRVLQRLPLGPKQAVALLQVGDRVLVVSMSEHGTRLLTELDDEPAVKTLVGEESAPAGKRRAVSRWLPFATAVVLACTAAAPGWAQAPTSEEGGALSQPLPFPSAVDTRLDITLGEGDEELKLTGAVGLVVFMGFLTLLPALLLLMTSFTRILIVLQFLRPAIGTQNSPPNQLLVALSVLLTSVVMHPVLEETNTEALQPYFKGEITQVEAYQLGVRPFREFMAANTGEKDLALFADLTGLPATLDSLDDIPTVTLASAFVTSELRTAFQMGFLIFVPFIVVDLIVASVLMSLGMFMLPPMMVSLPFKLLLFVLADGWALVLKNLVASFV